MIDARITLSIVAILSITGMTCILVDMIKNPEKKIVVRKKQVVVKPILNEDIEIDEDIFET